MKSFIPHYNCCTILDLKISRSGESDFVFECYRAVENGILSFHTSSNSQTKIELPELPQPEAAVQATGRQLESGALTSFKLPQDCTIMYPQR